MSEVMLRFQKQIDLLGEFLATCPPVFLLFCFLIEFLNREFLNREFLSSKYVKPNTPYYFIHNSEEISISAFP